MNSAESASRSARPSDGNTQSKRRFWLRIIWVSIAGVVVPIGLGFISMISHMATTFAEVGEGRGDAQSFARDTAEMLATTAWLWAVAVVAFVILIGALIQLRTLPRAK